MKGTDMMFRHCRDRIRLHLVTFRRSNERKLIMSILSRLAALESAQAANSGSSSDVVALKGEVEALSAKVDGAASQAALDAVVSDVAAIKDEIGTEPAPAQAAEPQA